MMTAPPYVVDSWVCGDRFYGRSAQLAQILEGEHRRLWLFGMRRVGKTSLLRQLEHLTARAPEDAGSEDAGSEDAGSEDTGSAADWFPLYWDFGDAHDPARLAGGWRRAVEGAAGRLAAVDVAADALAAAGALDGLALLRSALHGRDRRLLLLGDDAGELLRLRSTAPDLLATLRDAIAGDDALRVVLTSSLGPRDLLGQRTEIAPLVHAFPPVRYVHPLTDDEARQLLLQSRLPPAERPGLDDATVEQIRRACDNHPFLLQAVARAYLERGSLEEAVEWIAGDPEVGFSFAADFAMLSETERSIIRIIAERHAAATHSVIEELPVDLATLIDSLHRLDRLGFVRRNEDRRFQVTNSFFERWLSNVSGKQATRSASDRSPARGPGRVELDLLPDPSSLFAGRYELRQRIGRGSTGVVYRAWDQRLQTEIAVKVLKPHYASHPEALARFRQEIVLARDLAHPNILRVYDLGDDGDWRYLTMQLVNGPPLARLLARQGPLDLGVTLAVARKLAQALAALHERRILHLDVKPGNILMSRGYEPFLSDFGLARRMGEPDTSSTSADGSGGSFRGTPNYAAPEQGAIHAVDGRTDLYSLGVVLYEMVTGKKPFATDNVDEALALHRHAPPPDPRQLSPALPASLAALILRCLEKDPARRPPSAPTLCDELTAVAAELPVSPTLGMKQPAS